MYLTFNIYTLVMYIFKNCEYDICVIPRVFILLFVDNIHNINTHKYYKITLFVFTNII